MICDIKKYGALGDGKTNDTISLQSAIDDCAANGKILHISDGVYKIGTIILRSGTEIELSPNAVLSGITDIQAYGDCNDGFIDGVGVKRGKALLCALNVENVKISGTGKIIGNGAELDSEERPFLFRISNTKNVIINDITLESSPSWCLHIKKSQNVKISNIKIHNIGCENNDGIDIDSSANVYINGCDIISGDDGICLKSTSRIACENIVVKNCKVSSKCGGFKIGTETVGDIKNISVSDCYFYDVVGGGIKITPVDGALVKNVNIKNITMDNCTGPVFIATGERNFEYAGEYSEKLSNVEDVTIENLTADVVRAPIRFIYDGENWANSIGGLLMSGTPATKIKNITLKNIKASLPGGYVGKSDFRVREMEKMYPEFHRFDPTPAKGVYIRHAEGVKLINIELTYKENDNRNEIYAEDAEYLIENA